MTVLRRLRFPLTWRSRADAALSAAIAERDLYVARLAEADKIWAEDADALAEAHTRIGVLEKQLADATAARLVADAITEAAQTQERALGSMSAVIKNLAHSTGAAALAAEKAATVQREWLEISKDNR